MIRPKDFLGDINEIDFNDPELDKRERIIRERVEEVVKKALKLYPSVDITARDLYLEKLKQMLDTLPPVLKNILQNELEQAKRVQKHFEEKWCGVFEKNVVEKQLRDLLNNLEKIDTPALRQASINSISAHLQESGDSMKKLFITSISKHVWDKETLVTLSVMYEFNFLKSKIAHVPDTFQASCKLLQELILNQVDSLCRISFTDSLPQKDVEECWKYLKFLSDLSEHHNPSRYSHTHIPRRSSRVPNSESCKSPTCHRKIVYFSV